MKNLNLSNLAIIFCTLLFSFQSCKPDKTTSQHDSTTVSDTTENTLALKPKTYYCSIEIDNQYDLIDTFSVEKNSVFMNLFDDYETNDSLLFEAIGLADSIFPINKIIANRGVNMIYRQKNGKKHASHLIYHANETDRLVIGFRDSAEARWHYLPVDTIERSIYAKIDRTLYHSILDANTSYELGIKMSEVFAWQVNFFRIDASDFFKVIYDEYQVGGKAVKLGEIKSALFYHRGDSFYAFSYENGVDKGYYDENGQSLKKAFLKAPLKYSRISSRYTKRRFHPVQKRWKAHLGTDYAAPRGTPIRTVGDGKIVAASYSGGNGRYVKVEHNSTYTTQYLHMSRIATGIKRGKYVKQGEVIGYVGSTGLATGPHLCFRFWKNGVQVDPFKIKAPPTTPVSSENLEDFKSNSSQQLEKLGQIQLSTTSKSASSE